MTHRETYLGRINRVVDHIDAHLAEPLDLTALAAVAHFSPFHFHRLFAALTGETLAECVRRLRLERAAVLLLRSPPRAALTIALDVGFTSAEVFTRAFKSHFGVTPSSWRRGAWQAWAQRNRDQLSKIHQAHRKQHQAVMDALAHDRLLRVEGSARANSGAALMMQIEVKNLADVRVAYMRHVGPYGSPSITAMWQRFSAWCHEHGLARPGRLMYGVTQDAPDVTPPEKCRYDACIEVDADFRPSGEVGVQSLAGGRFACARFTGTSLDIHAAWHELFARWLPDSGYQPDHRPCLELYDDGASVEAVTGRFSCWLCVPLKPL
jgi:AraC family transcriptional regulator